MVVYFHPVIGMALFANDADCINLLSSFSFSFFWKLFLHLMYWYFAFGIFLQLLPLLLRCHLLTKLISWSFKMAGREWCHDSMFLDLKCSDLLDTGQFPVSLINSFFSSPILILLITVNHQRLNDLHLLLALIWSQILASHTLGKSDVFFDFTNVLVSCFVSKTRCPQE